MDLTWAWVLFVLVLSIIGGFGLAVGTAIFAFLTAKR